MNFKPYATHFHNGLLINRTKSTIGVSESRGRNLIVEVVVVAAYSLFFSVDRIDVVVLDLVGHEKNGLQK